MKFAHLVQVHWKGNIRSIIMTIMIIVRRWGTQSQSRRLTTRGSSLAWLRRNSRHTWILLFWKGTKDHDAKICIMIMIMRKMTISLTISISIYAQQLVNVLGEWREGRTREAAESRELEVKICKCYSNNRPLSSVFTRTQIYLLINQLGHIYWHSPH